MTYAQKYDSVISIATKIVVIRDGGFLYPIGIASIKQRNFANFRSFDSKDSDNGVVTRLYQLKMFCFLFAESDQFF